MNIFFNDLPVYFINLDRRKDRLEYFLDHAAALGINNAHRFKAVDGADITTKIDGLSSVQIACSTSHILVLKEFLKSNSNFAMICEDDADLSNSKKINFNFYELLEHMPKNVECIQTSLVLRKEDVMPFKISQRSMFYFSTASYIISKEYAQYLIDKYCNNIVDLSIFRNSYVVDPRGGTMELTAVADQLIYESAGTFSIGLFTTILDRPDISTTTEQVEQFVSSRKQFTDHWNKYEIIKIKDIAK